MIVLFGNQKGGAGKSTLTLLMANYLSQIKNRKVTVLDMDYQQSISSKAEKGKLLENEESYEVIPADLSHFPNLYALMKDKKDHFILIDLPGKMDDDGLIPILAAANVIICPFAYDEFSVDSTLLFTMVFKKINEKATCIFIPNRIKNTVRYDTKLEVDKVFQQFGAVTPGLSDRIDFQRLTTFVIPFSLIPIISPVFDLIYDQYFMKGKGS
jgi:chromosome partitioning protein